MEHSARPKSFGDRRDRAIKSNQFAQLTGPRCPITQLKDRGYAAKYVGLGQPIYLLGIEFHGRDSPPHDSVCLKLAVRFLRGPH